MSVLHNHGVIYDYLCEIQLFVPTAYFGTCTSYFVIFAASGSSKISCQAGNSVLQQAM